MNIVDVLINKETVVSACIITLTVTSQLGKSLKLSALVGWSVSRVLLVELVARGIGHHGM
jgi:hypothetical protein